jgi:cytoskeleton protein RodZ
MTDDNDQLTAPVPVPVVAESESKPKPTAGTLMRRAREASGLHIAALAVSLKVPVKRLEALEADRFDLLPDVVFVRALANSVCRSLKLDPAPILQLLPNQSPSRFNQQSDSLRVPHGATISSRRGPLFGALSRPAVIGGLVLVVGALALALLPPLDFSWTPTKTSESDPVLTQPLPVMAVEPSIPDSVALNSSPAVSGLVVPAASVAVSKVPASAGIVVFKTSADSWVEVTDAKGNVLLSRKLSAGEEAGVSGALPLSAVVGRADVTLVQVRGQSFDLAPVSRGNVARFEVN